MNPPAEIAQRIVRLAPLKEVLVQVEALARPVVPHDVAHLECDQGACGPREGESRILARTRQRQSQRRAACQCACCIAR